MAVSGDSVERKGMIQQLFSQSATGADNAIIAAPADAAYRIEIVSCLGLSLDTDGTVELQSGTESIWKLDMSARAPFAFRGTREQPWLICEPGQALDLLTTGGAAELTLLYRIAPKA